jgi:hypothetical protein
MDCMFLIKQKRHGLRQNFQIRKIVLQERNAVKGFVQFSPGEYVISSDKGIFRYSANRNTIQKG